MQQKNLGFAVLNTIEPAIMEVIAKEGVELTAKDIEKIEDILLDAFEGPYGLLVNRIHSYSHSAESMNKIAKLYNMVCMAIVVYNDVARTAAQLHAYYQNNVRIFDDVDTAKEWLINQIKAKTE